MKGILIYAEVESGRVHPVAFELLGKAREIGEKISGQVWSIILGHEIKDLASELIRYGADKVFVYDHPTLRESDLMILRDPAFVYERSTNAYNSSEKRCEFLKHLEIIF